MADDAYVKSVCEFFYGSKPDKVTAKITDVIALLLWSAIEKQKVIDLVPRPPGGKASGKWLLLEAIKIFFRTMAPTKIGMAARNAAAVQHKSMYELAKLDL